MSLKKLNNTYCNFWKEQMQDYLIMKGQIDSIENENAHVEYTLNEWTKLDPISHATIQMYLSKIVYYTVQSCSIAFELRKTLLNTHEKKVVTMKIYLIQHLSDLQMKEYDSAKT